MSHDVGVAAHADEEAAETVFEAGIDPLGGGPFAESDVGSRIEGDRIGAARMRIDQRDAAQVAGERKDIGHIVRRVGQVIAIANPPGGDLRQGNGGLRVVKCGGGEEGATGNVAIGTVERAFVPGPLFLIPLALAFAAHSAGGRHVGQGLGQRAVGLKHHASRRLGAARRFVFGRPRFFVGSGGGGGMVGAGFSRAGMAVASRLTWPMSFGPRYVWIIAACTWWGSSPLAKAAKAREKVASEGRSATRSHPHKRRTDGALWRESRRARGVGKFHVAMKAFRMAWRSSGLRPLNFHRKGIIQGAMSITATTRTHRTSVSESGPSSSSKGQQARPYVYLPLAAAIGLSAGESVQWELLDRGKLHLARQHSAQPSAKGTRRKQTGKPAESPLPGA